MKLLFKILVFALVALLASVLLWVYLNGYLIKTKASNWAVQLAFAEKNITVKGGALVHGDLTITSTSGISGIDLIFTTEGNNLAFSYADTMAHLPVGFESVLDELGMTTAVNGYKTIRRMVLVSKKPAAQLPQAAVIPLYFTVINSGVPGAKTSVSVDLTASQIVGVPDANVSGTVFALSADETPLRFMAEIEDPRAAPVTNLECSSMCSQNVILKWTDSPNEDGYRIYKDGAELATLGKNTTAYPYKWCGNYGEHTYAVISYNDKGSVSTTDPVINCACARCPTQAPPTPTPLMPINSADIMFRVNFPDVDKTIDKIPHVKVTVFDNQGGKICPDDIDCAQIVTFTRMYTSQGPTSYFSSPQLQYNLTQNRAYSIVVKQSRTVQRTYKNVFLVWKTLLNCLVPNPTVNHGCGQLISSDLDSRPLFSGDMEGLDSSLPGFNIINMDDREKVGKIAEAQSTLQTKSTEGDMNFDGSTDVRDIGIIEKNFNKRGD